MPKYWFRQHGRGARFRPTCWQGWAVQAAFPILMAANGVVTPRLFENAMVKAGLMLGLMIAIQVAYIRIIYLKSDVENWRWPWRRGMRYRPKP